MTGCLVTLRSGGNVRQVKMEKPPRVGTWVTWRGGEWFVTGYEYPVKRRVAPYSVVLLRAA